MIEQPPLVRLRRGYPRPTPEQVAAFAGAQTGNVADALGGRAALGPEIGPVLPEAASFCGVALTTDAGPRDVMGVFMALELAQPGDVLVISADGYRETAVLGDVVAEIARDKGVVGLVTDGCVRDLAGLRAVGLPVFARGVTPDSPNCAGPCHIGLPVNLGGRMVASGDIVIGDADGVVSVPREEIDAAITGLARVRAAEAELIAQVRAGERRPGFVAEILGSGRVTEMD